MMLLEKLCNAFGPSGCEGEIRDILLPVITPLCDSVTVDSIGNLIAFKKGRNSKQTIMLAAHMDEVGLIIKNITAGGYLEFDTVGGIDARVLVSKAVTVGDSRISGVIGARPKHLMGKDNPTPEIKELRIDIGAKDKSEAEKYVSAGDYAVFDSDFICLANRGVAAKALDDRAGCYILTRLMQSTYEDDIYFVFTVQEEVGCRGARVAAYNIAADKAIVIEGTTCADLAIDDDYDFSTKSGKGGAISIFDRGSRADRDIIEELIQAADKNNIKWQYKQTTMGGNDAGSIHIARAGIKTGAISVPCRYIHSPVSVASLSDIEAVTEIISAYLKEKDYGTIN